MNFNTEKKCEAASELSQLKSTKCNLLINVKKSAAV